MARGDCLGRVIARNCQGELTRRVDKGNRLTEMKGRKCRERGVNLRCDKKKYKYGRHEELTNRDDKGSGANGGNSLLEEKRKLLKT